MDASKAVQYLNSIINALSISLFQLLPSADLHSTIQRALDYIWENLMNLKTPEAILVHYIDIVFNPKLILRHLLVIGGLQFMVVVSQAILVLCETAYESLTRQGCVTFLILKLMMMIMTLMMILKFEIQLYKLGSHKVAKFGY
jgi:hypothetical protein